MLGDGPGIQRRRAGDELEHASRLVQVADGLVPPLGLLGQLQGGGALLAGQGIDGVPGRSVGQNAGLVGVVGGGRGHGQHGPGVDVQHDAHRPRGHMVLLHGVLQGVFKVVLDVAVDGQPQTVALGGEALCFVALREGVAPCVDGGEDHAVLAGEQVVVFEFQP